MRPDFGAGLAALVFEPLSATTRRARPTPRRGGAGRVGAADRRRRRAASDRAGGHDEPSRRRGRLPRARDEHLLQPRLSVLPARGGARHMTRVAAPALTPSSVDALARRAAHAGRRLRAGLAARVGRPGEALLRSTRSCSRALAERIDARPTRTSSRSSTCSGSSCCRHRPARAPVVFTTAPARRRRARAGRDALRRDAARCDRRPIVFETEQPVALARRAARGGASVCARAATRTPTTAPTRSAAAVHACGTSCRRSPTSSISPIRGA